MNNSPSYHLQGRKQKIALLKQLSAGLITAEALLATQNYFLVNIGPNQYINKEGSIISDSELTNLKSAMPANAWLFLVK